MSPRDFWQNRVSRYGWATMPIIHLFI